MLKKTSETEDVKRLDVLVENYITVRDHIKEVEATVKKALAPFETKKAELTAELLKMLDDLGAESSRTKAGTVTAMVRRTAALSDPDAFMDFVRENDAYELMDRRANATACYEHAQSNNGTLPPGVKLNSMRYVGVRT